MENRNRLKRKVYDEDDNEFLFKKTIVDTGISLVRGCYVYMNGSHIGSHYKEQILWECSDEELLNIAYKIVAEIH